MKSSYRAVFVILFLTFLTLGGTQRAVNSIYDKKAGDQKSALRGMSAKVDALFREYDRPDVPGASIIIIKDGRVLFKKSYGAANLEDRIATTTGTNYRLASVTKQFTAMAIMILAERNKLTVASLTSFLVSPNTANRSLCDTCSITPQDCSRMKTLFLKAQPRRSRTRMCFR
jgi:CubicO group peptidase (beta-lactamase class C family)